MRVRKAYSTITFSGCTLFCPSLLPAVFILLIFFSFNSSAFSQESPDYEEISVFLDMQEVGGVEIDAIIKGTELYLPVTDLFDFLKIRNLPSPGLENITGFFINQEATYSISRVENLIIYQGKSFKLEQGDLIRTESNLYLRASFFDKVFGLECKFNFRALSVSVISKLELPLIREMRLEKMRNNISRLKGEVKADSTIGRTYPLFKFGMADWSAIASEEINGKTDTRFNLSLGSMIAGGEATASLYYNSTDPFSEKQQYYLWRYVNNDFGLLRQIMAGKIATNSISSIYNPVVGIQLTNTPTTYRRSFGSYPLSDKTEPGWIVELYINNVLVDYVKADASGFFTFEVPLVYGNSTVKLKYFGPWGEERTREQNISIPYNFLPEKTFEYTLSGGIVEDSMKSRFSRGSVNYGLTRSLTLGGGAEYLSSVTSRPLMPYLNASVRVTNNLLLSGEFAYGVRTKGTLSYRLPSNLQLDLNYTWYNKDQKAIFYNYRQERKASLIVPLKFGKFSTFQRFSIYQIILPASKFTTGEWLISGSVLGINTNLTTYALMLEKVDPYFYSNLSMSFRLPAGIVVIPQVQYGYNENKIFSAKVAVEKHLLEHAFLNMTYEQNFRNNLTFAEVGFRYDFSFAQTGVSVRLADKITSFIQYARGSLINDRKTKYLGTDNRFNVGRGGITVVPFLDINGNGKKDPGEPKAYGLNLHSNSGRIEKSDRDSTIRILGLEPYTSCFIDLDPNSFENISWRLSKETYSVTVDPDILKTIEIPVKVFGEANGTVRLVTEGAMKGLARVIVNFITTYLKPAGRTLTEEDGYFSYFGLTAGKYIVRIDTTQLQKLKMTSDPEFLTFTIKTGINGDIVDGLDFRLKTKPEEINAVPEAKEEKPVAARNDTAYMIIHEVSEEVYTITQDSWTIQIGAFKQKSLAEGFQSMLERELGKNVQITIEGEYYRVRILDLPTRQEVDENVIKLNKLGFKELWIVRLLARQQQRLLITKEDSLARIRATRGEIPAPVSPAGITVQLGAFRVRSNAVAFLERLSASPDKNITIVRENGFYKVRLSVSPLIHETVLDGMKKLMPEIGKLGLKEFWIVPVSALPVEELPIRPAERVTVPVKEVPAKPAETVIAPVELPKEINGLVKPGLPSGFIESKAAALIVPPEPEIALQVAVVSKLSLALRAQRIIITKLNLPVEIVKQFEYYHVIVTGFFTREETYKYYPELAGLGYPAVTLIQNYKRQK